MDSLSSSSAITGRHTLPKAERLAGRSDIGRLFAHGEAFLVYPVKCTYLFHGDGLNRVMVIAPKRNHKRAVARNLLKRRMREAYRLHKEMLDEAGEGSGLKVDLALSYVAKGEPLDYRTIERAVVSILNKLCTIRNKRRMSAADGAAGAAE